MNSRRVLWALKYRVVVSYLETKTWVLDRRPRGIKVRGGLKHRKKKKSPRLRESVIERDWKTDSTRLKKGR
jgi:hypothetical protein